MKKGKDYNIGYVPGVYDLFHIGHLNLIRKCKSKCKYLIVGVLTDELVMYYKGEKPYIPYEQRAEIIGALRDVDQVVKVDFSITDKMEAWKKYRYDCHFSGDDHNGEWDQTIQALQAVGSNLEFFNYTDGISSTKLKKTLKERLLYEEDFFNTFDIFDTLITRRTGTPHGIFALIQDKLKNENITIPDRVKKNFFDLRIYYEGLASDKLAGAVREELTLNEIYDVFATYEELNDVQKNMLMTMEKKTEIENVVGIPGNIERVQTLMEKNRHIALISNMYLDEATLREMIIQVAPDLKDIKIYVSSAYGKRKESRGLYKVVKEAEDADYFRWIHCGDNRIADIEIPASLGIRTVYFDAMELTDEEMLILANRENQSELQKKVGQAKNGRLFGEKHSIECLDLIAAPKDDYGLATYFPINILRKKCAIYGAGKLGKDLWHKLKDANEYELVAWADKNYVEFEQKTENIISPENLVKYSFDHLIIAVKNKVVAMEIKKELICFGIDEKRIVWVDLH